MPNTKSAKKAMRSSARKRVYNLRSKTKFKDAIKIVRKSIEGNNLMEAEKNLRLAFSALDKSAKKGVIHKNTASRKKSRLAKSLKKITK